LPAVITINNIRIYEEGDHDEVVALWEMCFSYPAVHNNPDLSIRRKTALDDSLFFVAASVGRVTATIMAGWDGHRGWIYSLAVHPDIRGTGLGRQLVNHAVNELKKRNCPKVNIQVMPGNTGVIGFYRKLGFTVEERVSMGMKLY